MHTPKRNPTLNLSKQNESFRIFSGFFFLIEGNHFVQKKKKSFPHADQPNVPIVKTVKTEIPILVGTFGCQTRYKNRSTHTQNTHTQSCIRTKSLSLMIMDNSFRAALFNTSIQGLQYARLLVHFIV